LKKYKLYLAAVLGFLIIAVVCLGFYLSGQDKPQKAETGEENLVYFDVNSQKAPAIPKSKEPTVDESALNADKYNKEMYDVLKQRPAVKLPSEGKAPNVVTKKVPLSKAVKPYLPKTKQVSPAKPKKVAKPYKVSKPYKTTKPQKQACIVHPYKARQKYRSCYKKHQYKTTKSQTKYKTQKKVCNHSKTKPTRHYRPTQAQNYTPVQEYSQTRILTKVKLDYSDATLLSKFINSNIRANLAVPQNSSEIILAGYESEIDMAKQIIKLLDTCPKVQVFHLSYIRPMTMANMLANSVFGGECCVYPDGNEFQNHTSPFVIYYNNANNTITIVGASPKQMELAQNFINLTDLKSPQAFLDILIVEFNDLGISKFQQLAQPNITSSGDGIGVCSQNLFSTIKGIVSNGGGKILASPKITVSNDSDYSVSATSKYEPPEITQDGDVCNVEHCCGTRLKIHSVINQNGEVFLSLEPQYTKMRKVKPDESNPDGVMFEKKSLQLENIRLADGQTLCVGGAKSTEEYTSLGIKHISNTELMMFVNVHLQK
jgi:hypothetical protein